MPEEEEPEHLSEGADASLEEDASSEDDGDSDGGRAAEITAGVAAAVAALAGHPLVYVHRRWGTVHAGIHRAVSAMDYDIRPDHNLPGPRCKLYFGRDTENTSVD